MKCVECGRDNDEKRITCWFCGCALPASAKSLDPIREQAVAAREETSTGISGASESYTSEETRSTLSGHLPDREKPEGAAVTKGIQESRPHPGARPVSEEGREWEQRSAYYPPWYHGFPPPWAVHPYPGGPPTDQYRYQPLPGMNPYPFQLQPPFAQYPPHFMPMYSQYPPQPYAPYPHQHPTPQPSYPHGYPQQGYQTERVRTVSRPRKKRIRLALAIILIIIVVCGVGAAAFLLTRTKGVKKFEIGDATVTGARIELKNMSLTKDNEKVTLKGNYVNNTREGGTLTITIDVTSRNGMGEFLNFIFAIGAKRSGSFSKTLNRKVEVDSADFGSAVFSRSSSSESGRTFEYPEDFGNSSRPENESGTEEFNTNPYANPYGEEMLKYLMPNSQSGSENSMPEY